MSTYEVRAGRQIYRDGRPFISIHREGDTMPVEADSVTHFIARILSEYGEAYRHHHRRYQSNPALVIYGNPPLARVQVRRYDPAAPMQIIEEISIDVHYLGYRHREDGKLYEHAFDLPTSMLAVLRHDRHDVLLTSPEKDPIWQEF